MDRRKPICDSSGTCPSAALVRDMISSHHTVRPIASLIATHQGGPEHVQNECSRSPRRYGASSESLLSWGFSESEGKGHASSNLAGGTMQSAAPDCTALLEGTSDGGAFALQRALVQTGLTADLEMRHFFWGSRNV
jgi:hypothetical protein